jgi:hypothetical protein
MALKDSLIAGMQKLIDRAGTPIKISYYSQTIGSVWDDEVVLTNTSSVWTSGIELPINTQKGSFDSLLQEQGKLIDGDIKLFTDGTIFLNSSGNQFKIGIGGSPVPLRQYYMIPDGALNIRASNTNIYRKIYLRQLTNGSLVGE